MLYNPYNERLKKEYEVALLHRLGRDSRTTHAVWRSINMFEDFCQHRAFVSYAEEDAIAFKERLIEQKSINDVLYSLGSIRSIMRHLREFFLWVSYHPRTPRRFKTQMIEYLHLPGNLERAGRASKPVISPTVAEVKQVLAAMPSETPVQVRDRAVVAIVALTALRDGALISLKLGDVDLHQRQIWQDPKHVKTKTGKGILSAFVEIDAEWRNYLATWIVYLQEELGRGDKDWLFPKTLVETNQETQEFEVSGFSEDRWHGAGAVRRIFREAFETAGLSYFNPHTLRRTQAVWGMENLSQIEFKALSQNMGHEHTMTSYNSYGNLPAERQVELIRGIGQQKNDLAQASTDDLLRELGKRTKYS